jgi:hypothetical protein
MLLVPSQALWGAHVSPGISFIVFKPPFFSIFSSGSNTLFNFPILLPSAQLYNR